MRRRGEEDEDDGCAHRHMRRTHCQMKDVGIKVGVCKRVLKSMESIKR